MVHAFVFVGVATGDTGKLPAIVEGVDEVTEAHVVAGDHDVIVEMDAETVYDVLSTVTAEIRPLEGIDRTRTYVALE